MSSDSPAKPPTWRRKTEEERRRGMRRIRAARFDPTWSAIIGFILFLLCVPPLLKTAYDGEPVEFLLRLSIAIGIFGVIIAYIFQVLGWLSRPHRLRVGICNHCFTFTIDGKKDRCECGGEFEDSDGWTLNQCPKCGYDLRESGDRCPECGQKLVAAEWPA